MDGPHHYREAQTYLHRAEQSDAGSSGAQALVAKAQVHATLALAAATALPTSPAEDWLAAMEFEPTTPVRSAWAGGTGRAWAWAERLTRNGPFGPQPAAQFGRLTPKRSIVGGNTMKRIITGTAAALALGLTSVALAHSVVASASVPGRSFAGCSGLRRRGLHRGAAPR